MKKLWFQWDEHSEQVAGRNAMITLGLTQVVLGVVLLTRLYIQGQRNNGQIHKSFPSVY